MSIELHVRPDYRLTAAIESLQAAVRRREAIESDQASCQCEAADEAVCLSVRRAFTRFVDCSAWSDQPDPESVEGLIAVLDDAERSLESSVYAGAERCRELVDEKLRLLKRVRNHGTFDDGPRSDWG